MKSGRVIRIRRWCPTHSSSEKATINEKSIWKNGENVNESVTEARMRVVHAESELLLSDVPPLASNYNCKATVTVRVRQTVSTRASGTNVPIRGRT